jgi:two-component system, LytTR family, response regulator
MKSSSIPHRRSQSDPLRCLIVEDDSVARALLCKHLRLHREIELVGETGSVATALDFCRALHPDVIFLNINLPGAEGFLMMPMLPASHPPQIVFLSAPDDRIFEAFKLRALEHLIMPYSAKRVATLVEKLLRAFSGLAVAVPLGPPAEVVSELIWVKTESGRLKVRLAEIVVIEAEAPYSRLTLFDGNTYLLRRAMSYWEKLLPKADFMRVDRFRIINLRGLEKMERVSRNKSLITLRGMTEPKELGRQPSLRLLLRVKATASPK